MKHFLGTSENAVKTRVRCAVATDALIAFVKKELQLDASLYTLPQNLSVSVFEKTEVYAPCRPIVGLTWAWFPKDRSRTRAGPGNA
jgi:hypothetical protein